LRFLVPSDPNTASQRFATLSTLFLLSRLVSYRVELNPMGRKYMTDGRLTHTVEEAGKLLGLSRNSAYALARSGKLPTIRLGKRLLVPKAALERLLASTGEGSQ
jgi:excisionase family DNA binding protein